MVKNLFWSGGFDSTFRLLQLLENKEVTSINLYFLAFNIDNVKQTTVRRRSIKNELESINRILNMIDTSKISNFYIWGPHKNLIEYKLILNSFNFITFVKKEEIEYSNDLINALDKLQELNFVIREFSQYGSITQILYDLNIEAEVCIEKGDILHEYLSHFVNLEGRLIDDVRTTEIDYVFGKYEMSIFWTERKNMLEEASIKNWIKILSETWSCWYPVDNKPCKNCHYCKRRPFLSFINKKNKTITELVDDLHSVNPDFRYFSNYEINFIKKEEVDFKNSRRSRFEEKNEMRVTANIATQPHRFWNLLTTLESIRGQFDEVRIYLNGYDSVPDELIEYTTYIGKDLTDNGKMFWSGNPNEYYFTIDDDMIYPSDYVEITIPLIKDRIVCYDGKKTIGIGQSYYNSHITYSFLKEIDSEKNVEIGKSGLMAFNTNIFKPNLWKSPISKMCDVIIGLEAALYNIPIVCLPHKDSWIKSTISGTSIYKEFISDDTKQSSIVDMIQIYKNNQIRERDKIIKAGCITKLDIYELNEMIKKHKGERNLFYHIGSGSGKLICQMSIISDFDEYTGIDNVSERIRFSKSLSEINSDKINFIKSDFSEIDIKKNSVVYINDITMNEEESNKIWNRIPSGCQVICNNIISDEFPIDKINVETSWNKFLTKDLYLYLKS